MRDFKYDKLVTANASERAERSVAMKAFEDIRTDCLKPCAAAFRANMDRTLIYASLPVELCFQSSRSTRITANAIYNVTGQGSLSLREQIEIVPSPEMRLEFAKEVGESERMSKSVVDAMRMELGLRMVDQFLDRLPEMQSSMDAMFTSIVLESWLFFESLCSDLWVAGVDNGGKLIRGRMAMNRQWEKDKEGMQVVNLPDVQSNAQTHPGSFWRETGMVSFQRMRSIKSYFGIAFGNGAENLFEKTANGYIFALNAVRNCIAHSAGNIDGQFKAKTGSRFPEFVALNKGDRLLLDGGLVKKLRNAALETGLALLKFVDDLITPKAPDYLFSALPVPFCMPLLAGI